MKNPDSIAGMIEGLIVERDNRRATVRRARFFLSRLELIYPSRVFLRTCKDEGVQIVWALRRRLTALLPKEGKGQ